MAWDGNAWAGIYKVIKLVNGSYYSTIRESTAEGLAGADLRIGLDETLRSLVICDQGDISTDFGLSAATDPTIVIANAAGTYLARYTYQGLYTNAAHNHYGSRFSFTPIAAYSATDTPLHWMRGTLNAASGTQTYLRLDPVLNQSGTAAVTVFDINPSVTQIGSGTNYLAAFRYADAYMFSFGTTGIQTNVALSALTNTAQSNLVLGHNTSGTVAANFGTRVLFQLESSTTENTDAASIIGYWVDQTHATRAGGIKIGAYTTTTEQIGVHVIADSGGVKLGFYTATPVAQAANVGDPAGGGTVDAEARTAINSILDILENCGLMSA